MLALGCVMRFCNILLVYIIIVVILCIYSHVLYLSTSPYVHNNTHLQDFSKPKVAQMIALDVFSHNVSFLLEAAAA